VNGIALGYSPVIGFIINGVKLSGPITRELFIYLVGWVGLVWFGLVWSGRSVGCRIFILYMFLLSLFWF
jgi:hypothetical protein